MTRITTRFQSHQVLGRLLQLSLTPVAITVNVEVDLLGESPKADALLLRRQGRAWNAAQRARLPDGVRDSAASHVLLEFKYTESVNERALAQAVAYDHFYRQAQRLPEEQALTVVLSAKTPQKVRLAEWGYREAQAGVYHSALPLLRRVWLLVLNELPSKPHNAYVKLFASREREREAAFEALSAPEVTISSQLHAYMFGLQETLEVKGESDMAEMLTPDRIMEIGEKIRQRVLDAATPEERLAGLDPEERLAGLDPEERLAGLDPEERLAGLDLEERLAGLDPEERLAGLDPEERLAGLDPEERLAGLDLEERLRGLTQAERRHLLQLLQKEASAPSGDITNGNDDPA